MLAKTGGNPLWAVAMLRSLSDQGLLRRAEGNVEVKTLNRLFAEDLLWHEPGHNQPSVSTAGHGDRTVSSYGAQIFRLRDGKVVEFWGAPTDPYSFDELIG